MVCNEICKLVYWFVLKSGESTRTIYFDVLLYNPQNCISSKRTSGVSRKLSKFGGQLRSGFPQIRVMFEGKLRVISEVCEIPLITT